MNLVESILDDAIRIQCESTNLIEELASCRGFSKGGTNTFLLPYSNESELSIIMEKLNNLGFLFVNAGPGWHPGDVFIDLRNKGLVSGKFKTISWSAPNQPIFGSA